MSLLFPFYVIGILAIAGPILFHLFQRQPHGQKEFSSLMFLKPTPPKLTRRSRLSNLLLLLLRALAISLLAFAFSRPFLRESSLLDLDTPFRSVALLVDTSASMRREEMWKQTMAVIDKVVEDLRPTDQVSLFSFDRQPNTLISFEAWEDAESTRRFPLLKEQLGGLKPTWYSTDLAAALIAAGDALLQQRMLEDQSQPLQIVVFSDLQAGSNLAALQSYDWPEGISVDLRTVKAKKRTNASLQALPPDVGETNSSQVRILVRNEPGGERAQFALGWNDDDAKRTVDVHVPPGQTRVVRLTQPRGAKQLNLQGDDHPFDNELYLTETMPQKKWLWYVGDDRDDDQQSLFFYLRQATLDTRTQQVTIEKLDDLTKLAIAMPKQTPLIVLSRALADSALDDVRRYLQRGGRTLVVLQKSSVLPETADFIKELLDLSDVQIGASEENDYAMLANIEFTNSLFEPFADPRYSDFTKIRFWSHCRLKSSQEEPWTNVARFDDGSPALVEKQIQDGKVWILTSGWQPEESQLALSSKFIPLLHGMFGRMAEAGVQTASYEVGQPIKISPKRKTTSIVAPGGEQFTRAAMSEFFQDTTEAGIYQLRQGDELFSVAVNLSTDESRTQPLFLDRLEQLGLKLGEQPTVESLRREQRQMRNKELESSQQLWHWVILAALVALALETGLGARASQSTVIET